MPNKDLILKLTPEEAAKYTLKDFASEVYSKKSSLRMLYPTGFDFVDQFHGMTESQWKAITRDF